MITIEPTSILVASIGIIPGFLAWRSSQKTRRSVQLSGSDITVSNWNKLVQSLYGHINWLEANELRLKDELKATQLEAESFRAQATEEKHQLLRRIDELSEELEKLKLQIKSLLPKEPLGTEPR